MLVLEDFYQMRWGLEGRRLEMGLVNPFVRLSSDGNRPMSENAWLWYPFHVAAISNSIRFSLDLEPL